MSLCQNHMFDQISKGGHRLFMAFRAGAHHSLRSYLVLAGLACSCPALSRWLGGKKPWKKSQERLLRRLIAFELAVFLLPSPTSSPPIFPVFSFEFVQNGPRNRIGLMELSAFSQDCQQRRLRFLQACD